MGSHVVYFICWSVARLCYGTTGRYIIVVQLGRQKLTKVVSIREKLKVKRLKCVCSMRET